MPIYFQRDGGHWYAWTPDSDGAPGFQEAFLIAPDMSDLERPRLEIIAEMIARGANITGYVVLPLGVKINDKGEPQ